MLQEDPEWCAVRLEELEGQLACSYYCWATNARGELFPWMSSVRAMYAPLASWNTFYWAWEDSMELDSCSLPQAATARRAES